jgi:hypothetical protein
MAQVGFTPIKIYSSATATNVPLAANLAQGELAINTADGKLFYKDSSNVVQVIGWKNVPISAGGTGATTAPQANANLQTFTTTATAAGTTTLTNASTYYQYFTGSTTQTIVLPVVSTLSLGWSFHIANNSTGILTVQSSGLNAIGTILPGTTMHITCILITGTTAASWDYGITDFGSVTGTGSVVLSASPTFTGVPLAPTAAASTNTTQIATTAFVLSEITSAGGVTTLSGGSTGLRTYTTPTKSTTISVASPAVFTVASIDLPANNTQIELFTTGSLPTGLSVNTAYYVINSVGTTFNVSLTSGGVGVNTTVAGSGVQTFGIIGTSGDLVLDGVLAVANGGTGVRTSIGSGSVVLSTNPLFVDLRNSGDITFTTTGNRILGDFSSATLSDRVLFQSSTVNGGTVLGTIPNGSSTASGYVAYGAVDADNSAYGVFYISGTTTNITADKVGTGSYGAIAFSTSATERLRITTLGGIAFGGAANYGTAGQVLQSNGDASPTWQDGMTPTSGTAPYYGARAFAIFSTSLYSDISATYTQNNGSGGAGTIVTLTVTSHAYQVGHYIQVDITSGTGVDNLYVVTAVTPTTIRYTAGTSLNTSGNAVIKQCSLWNNGGNIANVVYQTTGVFIINFTTPMPYANYAAMGSCGTNNGATFVNADDNFVVFGSAAYTGIRTTQSIRGFNSPLENGAITSVTIFA